MKKLTLYCPILFSISYANAQNVTTSDNRQIEFAIVRDRPMVRNGKMNGIFSLPALLTNMGPSF
jgi:hypothetical protein